MMRRSITTPRPISVICAVSKIIPNECTMFLGFCKKADYPYNGVMKSVYLDHASITPTDKRVLKVIKKYYSSDYGNPSSIHGVGVMAKKVVEDARKKC
ncbi:aminotransferase class V-fold PLP-dependent enzyme, partial [Patescibacteria group bacterium]